MSERINKATFTTLVNRPPAAHFGIGKCTILDTGVTYESDGVEWVSSKSNDLTWSTKPTAAQFGKGQAWFTDIMAIGYSDGVTWYEFDPNNGAFASPVYNSDGTLASATISGIAYTFTYANGKLATVIGGGKTKTYTWSNGKLASVVVS